MIQKKPQDWVQALPGTCDRMEAFFSQVAYEPHRHDTYALGLTMAGVQSFSYRGSQRHSLPGQAVIIHPDEKHDGRAGTQEGFRYRVVYIKPALIQSALGGKALPFIQAGVSDDPRLIASLRQLLESNQAYDSHFPFEDALFDLAHALDQVAGVTRSSRSRFNYLAASRAKDFMDANLDSQIDLALLEEICGYNRWKLSRDFRVLYGTSPYRYITMRRLDEVRRRLLAGDELADIAYACLFSDQSHMNRQFKKTYGMTPKTWLTAQKSALTL